MPKDITLAYNLRGIAANNGLPYTHLNAETLGNYERAGLIVQERDAQGRKSGFCRLTNAGEAQINA